MSDTYIGVPFINQISPSFIKEDFTGDGSTTDFELTNAVVGQNAENIFVVVGTTVQEPDTDYSIQLDIGTQPKTLRFSSAPSSSANIYVVHRGIGTFTQTPATGSVGANQLAAGLKGYTVDDFTGDGSTTAYTMSETPANGGSVLVSVDGSIQKISSDYTISSNTLTFTSAPSNSAVIQIRHLGVRGVVRRTTPHELETYTGDGSTTAFTLSFSGVPTNSAFVHINGLMQEPTNAYSISGTTLTFTEAPNSGDTIMVRYTL